MLPFRGLDHWIELLVGDFFHLNGADRTNSPFLGERSQFISSFHFTYRANNNPVTRHRRPPSSGKVELILYPNASAAKTGVLMSRRSRDPKNLARLTQPVAQPSACATTSKRDSSLRSE